MLAGTSLNVFSFIFINTHSQICKSPLFIPIRVYLADDCAICSCCGQKRSRPPLLMLQVVGLWGGRSRAGNGDTQAAGLTHVGVVLPRKPCHPGWRDGALHPEVNIDIPISQPGLISGVAVFFLHHLEVVPSGSGSGVMEGLCPSCQAQYQRPSLCWLQPGPESVSAEEALEENLPPSWKREASGKPGEVSRGSAHL